MSAALALVTPLIISAVALFGLLKRIDVFSAITAGAAEGLRTVARIFPALIALLSGVYMLRASGALDALTELFTPLLTLLGIPPETAPLIFLRPVSGSGALGVGSELIVKFGADSLIGRTAAVMLGSTETTFYVIAVYFGAAGIKRSRHAIPAALIADMVGFVAAAATARWLWG